jgi:hypothetical protein
MVRRVDSSAVAPTGERSEDEKGEGRFHPARQENGPLIGTFERS